jgi:hypothetical protein
MKSKSMPHPIRPVALVVVTLLLAFAGATAAPAQSGYFFPDGERFEAGIPSPAEFLGYEIGSHHTRHDRIVAYIQELARLSDRATYQEIGTTHGHRVMPVLTVTTPGNHARLEEIRQQHLAAALPGGGTASADRPIVVHLGYGVHGNETSSSEAAMLTAYWLVAGQGAEVERYLAEGVYHIEPVLNPDGRDRHTHWANMHKGTPFVADPLDREHNEAWPGGRTNHYWFDLNRDWLPLVHPESRARIDFHHSWLPNVVTDYHEMGTNSTYFFEPTAPVGSWNPLIPERLYRDITLAFAEHWGRSLDEIGSLYFTREVFDNTYPGYGSTYPNFLGGLGLVFEQASARGHVQESTRHGELTFAFAIRNQVRTSLATVRAAVEHRQTMLDYQRDFFASGLREAERFRASAYVFGDPHDHSRNREFIDLLLRHRLEVYEVPQRMTAGGHTFEPGSAWIVPTRQPGYRLVRSIFERTEEFADSAFYDASTWTMSLAYGMPDAEVRGGRLRLGDRVTRVPQPRPIGRVPQSGYAYLLDWSDFHAPKALYHLLANGVRVEAAFQPFTARTNEGNRAYPRGSISVPVQTQEHGFGRPPPADPGGGGARRHSLPEHHYRRRDRRHRPREWQLPAGRGTAGVDGGGRWNLRQRGGADLAPPRRAGRDADHQGGRPPLRPRRPRPVRRAGAPVRELLVHRGGAAGGAEALGQGWGDAGGPADRRRLGGPQRPHPQHRGGHRGDGRCGAASPPRLRRRSGDPRCAGDRRLHLGGGPRHHPPTRLRLPPAEPAGVAGSRHLPLPQPQPVQHGGPAHRRSRTSAVTSRTRTWSGCASRRRCWPISSAGEASSSCSTTPASAATGSAPTGSS